MGVGEKLRHDLERLEVCDPPARSRSRTVLKRETDHRSETIDGISWNNDVERRNSVRHASQKDQECRNKINNARENWPQH